MQTQPADFVLIDREGPIAILTLNDPDARNALSGPAQWDAHIMGVPTAKSQNTNLHVMEAFTALLRIWPDDSIRQSLREMIEVMLDRILDSGPDFDRISFEIC